jgi:hypothetical protein
MGRNGGRDLPVFRKFVTASTFATVAEETIPVVQAAGLWAPVTKTHGATGGLGVRAAFTGLQGHAAALGSFPSTTHGLSRQNAQG